MATKYGPWATLIDTGGRPQLSAFWRRRLTMLVPASRTNPVLSRGNILILMAAGILTCVLPTLFFTPAAAQEKKPADGNAVIQGTSSSNAQPHKSSTESEKEKGFTITEFTGDNIPPNYIWIPSLVYADLDYESARKELKISPDQENKLREISDSYSKQQRDGQEILRKEFQNLTPQEQIDKQRELRANLAQARNSVRKQIEKLLTPEQTAALRNRSVGLSGIGRILHDNKFREKIGVSEEQKNELSRSLSENLKEKSKSRDNSFKEFQEKSLAVLAPEQWEKLRQLADESEDGIGSLARFGLGVKSYPGPEIQELSYPSNELSLTDDQRKKLDEIAAKSQKQIMELTNTSQKIGRFLPEKEREEQNAAFMQKLEGFGKHDREQIKAALTPQQWIAFQKSCLRHTFIMNLGGLPGSIGFGGGKAHPDILDLVNATDQQRNELRLFAEQKDKLLRQTNGDMGEIALKMLSPSQQEKLFEALDNIVDQDAEPPEDAAKSADGSQPFTKIGIGVITITGSSMAESAATTRQSAAKIGEGAETAKFVVGTVTVAGPSASAQPKESITGRGRLYVYRSEYIPLPTYSALSDTKIRKQIGLSAEQEKKLREISDAFVAENQKSSDRLIKMKPAEQKAKQAELQKEWEQLRMNCRKQIEEVLTAQQLDDCKKLVFPQMAYGMLFDPQVRKTIELAPAQKDKVKQLRDEMGRGYQRELDDKTEKAMTLLSPEQLKKLRTEVERIYRESHEPVIEEPGPGSNSYSGSTTVTAGTLTVVGGSYNTFYGGSGDFMIWSAADSETEIGYGKEINSVADFISLPVYENLGNAEVRKTLGISTDQERKLKELSADAITESKELYGQWQGRQATEEKQSNERQYPFEFSADDKSAKEQQRKLREYQRESAKLNKDVREKIEALLTGQQMSALKDNLFQYWSFGRLIDPAVQQKLGLSDRQKAEIELIDREFREKVEKNEQEVFKKALDVLAPGQQEKLRAEIDRRGW
jgi:hypothetical protein